MAAIATFIETRTTNMVSSGATSFTHGLARVPHMYWATCRQSSIDATSAIALMTLNANSTGVTARSHTTPITATVCIAFFHSIIQ